ncbi:MAG TPA: zinc-ribbon domain-containing protein [Methyloradius sp.]|nr:zinc-ribbon domain-containing protein [Methyloradius sp.]
MALIKCHECGHEISTEAKACPQCGAEPKQKTGCLAYIGIFIVVCIIINAFSKGDETSSKPQETQAECAKTDLQCLGDKGIVSASVYCERAVERLAAHSVKWTDGTFEQKFSRFRWKDQASGVITYVGDKAEFQNGFGAFTPMIYECDLANDNKTVLDTRATEGRLP